MIQGKVKDNYNMDMWIKSDDEKRYQKYHLYIFEEVIVAYQMETREEVVTNDKGDAKSGFLGLGPIQKKQISKEG